MEYRSTSAGQHHSGHVVAGVGSSHAIEIGGGSTGATIQAVGDDANITLRAFGKGTGATVLGNSSSPVTLSGKVQGGITVGSSGSSFSEIRKFTVEFTAPVLSSGVATGVESTYTVSGVSTGTVLIFTPTNLIDAKYNVRARCSTTNELILAWSHDGTSTLGSGESSNRGVLIQFR